MAKTRVYDIEICVEEGQLKIIPYRLQIQYQDTLTPYFSTDTTKKAKVFKCAFTKKNNDIISYVLDLDEWEMRGDWDGYSDWQVTDYLQEGDTPNRIKKWLEELPTYELRLEYAG
jgi:hypothetical protein